MPLLSTSSQISRKGVSLSSSESQQTVSVGAEAIGVPLRGGKDIARVSAGVSIQDLELLSELIEAGKVRPVIDRRYPFAEIPAAIA
jgi:NADPH:quinone reductase-like Zn-dependent oxidoreductase